MIREETLAILKRLRRKVEIVRLDMKNRTRFGSPTPHSATLDCDELLSLLDMLERDLTRTGSSDQ